MALLPIKGEGEPILRQRAEPVAKVTKRLRRLIADMIETMHEADGCGLAAPQVGEGLRVIVIDVGDGPLALVNPEIVASSGEDTDMEGCLSIPHRAGYVTRAAEVTAKGLNEQGRPVQVTGSGLLARALQHECDHLDGVLFIDRASGLWEKKGAAEHQ